MAARREEKDRGGKRKYIVLTPSRQFVANKTSSQSPIIIITGVKG